MVIECYLSTIFLDDRGKRSQVMSFDIRGGYNYGSVESYAICGAITRSTYAEVVNLVTLNPHVKFCFAEGELSSIEDQKLDEMINDEFISSGLDEDEFYSRRCTTVLFSLPIQKAEYDGLLEETKGMTWEMICSHLMGYIQDNGLLDA